MKHKDIPQIDCPNCMDELILQEVQEDAFGGDEKTFIYKCENNDCDNEHDSNYYYQDGELYDGLP